MKKLLKSLILIFSIGTTCWGQIYMEMAMDTTMSYEDIVDEGESFFEQHGRGQHTGYKSFKRWQYWMKRCLDKDGHMMSGAKVNDEFQKFQVQENSTRRNLNVPSWTDLGPYDAGNTNGWSSHLGRITSIGIDDNNIDHILVGSPTGGVWKTTTGGARWEPIYDYETVLDIYSLAISPHNPDHYYIGTWGAGIRRSLDGGQTWIETNGISSATRIIDIVVSPTDPKICVAINEGGNVFQSSDGGARWDVALIHSGTLYDLEFKPGDANTVYASGKAAVFISTDKGWTFRELRGPWVNSGMTFNPIMMAVTEADPEYLYVLEADNGGFGAVYLSKDGGNTFTTQSSDANGDNNLMGYAKTTKGGQAPRDMDISVNPEDKNEVHIGGIMSHRSLDGARNWEQTSHWLRNDPLPFIHADIDIIVYKNGRVFFGTDGGLFSSDDRGLSFTDRSAGLSIRQFYRLAISNDGELLVGGSQDNGAGLLKDSNGWWDFVGADGMEPIIDKDDKDLIYASIQYGNIYKTSNGGVTLDGGVTQTPGFGEWVTPIEQDPIIPNTLYQGKGQLFKTSDGMRSWTIISNFTHSNEGDTLMQEIDISLVDNNYIIVGFEQSVYKTINGGVSWTDISPPFSFSNVNYISIHPTDKNWVTITLSGTDKRVVQTTDGGNTWENIMANLPNTGAECAIYEGGPKNGIYVSMNPGVYYRDGSSPEWQLASPNMPNVLVAELEISGCEIYAATYGRGMWSAPLIDDTEYFVDSDGDGYGDSNRPYRFCQDILNYTLIGGDCNDANPSINPAAIEACNGLDDDCNGLTDSDDPNSSGTQIWYRDADNDGFGNNLDSQTSCSQPTGFVLTNTDCDDSNSAIYPSATELCNGLDDDCNGQVDDNTLIGSIQNWYRDTDGDGYGDASVLLRACSQPSGYVLSSSDCDDTDSNVNPAGQEICNGLDDDCNGQVDDNTLIGSLQNWYRDTDGDGYGDASVLLRACSQPSGYVLSSSDCDDTDSNVNPAGQEICNGLDDDCNGQVDDNTLTGSIQNWYRDTDGDGYGDASVLLRACSQPSGYVLFATDCDDTDSNVNPAGQEICNGIDDDCNGQVDDNTLTGNMQNWYRDTDGDGYGDGSVLLRACSQPSGYVLFASDCDDTDSNVNPAGQEICNGIDDDCNGQVDDNTLTGSMQNWYRDTDGDGYGDASVLLRACSQPSGYVLSATDCDDTDSNVNPAGQEICNGLDDDCNGQVDDNTLTGNMQNWYRDTDGDGYGDGSVLLRACSQPSGYVLFATDCDDTDSNVNPVGQEICNGIDDDCNGQVDDNIAAGSIQNWYRDTDGDGYGNASLVLHSCTQPLGYVLSANDCDDTDANVNPASQEICNGLDDDCNGLIDLSDPNITGATTWYRDADGDGYGDSSARIISCSSPLGYVLSGTDCNDNNSAINPAASETCNGSDDDCNGLVDDDDPNNSGAQWWFRDSDGDGFGNSNNSRFACNKPAGYVLSDMDCNDSVASINPAAPELCNAIDDNCNGLIDSYDPNHTGIEQSWYVDKDGDGYGNITTEVVACTAPSGYVMNASDCDDNNPNIHPGVAEICNGIDDNCNGLTDSADPELVGARLWYADNDGDGYGLEEDSRYACARPRNYVSAYGDCDDNNATIMPGTIELCDDIDNDCDGTVDEGCESIGYCDGNYLFIRAAFQDSYSAGTALYSNAKLTGTAPQLYTAGESIDLLPGFEVEAGKQFEAIIRPCFNGVSPVNPNINAEFKILNEALNESIEKKELVKLVIIDRELSRTYQVIFTKNKVNLSTATSRLPKGQFTVSVETESFEWHRDIDVIGYQ